MTNSSIVEGIMMISDNLAGAAIDISKNNGIWTTLLYVFAFIGFVSLAYSVFNNMWKGTRLAMYGFIFLPAAFVVSIINKNKRKERLKEWGEMKDHFTGKNKVKFWIWLIIKIGIPLVIIIMAIKWYF